jgi:hypothetical protein
MRPALRGQRYARRYEHLRLAITKVGDAARLSAAVGAVGSGNGMGKNIHDVHSLSLEKNIVNHIMKNNCMQKLFLS